MTNSESHNPLDDEINLLDLLLIAREEWAIIASTTIAGMAIAIAAAFIMTPIYKAEAVVSKVDSSGAKQSAASAMLGQVGGLARLAGVDLGGLGGEPGDARTIIQSRTFIEDFIVRRNLMPIIYSDIWDEAEGSWVASIENPPAVWQGANRFIEETFRLDQDDETGLLTAVIEWSDPEQAAAWANDLISLANETTRQRDIADAEASIEYLNQQIAKTSVVDLQRALYNLLEAELQTLMLANARKEYAFRVVDRAVVPVRPVKPNGPFLFVIGTLAGGFLGLVIVLLKRIVRGLREQLAAQ